MTVAKIYTQSSAREGAAGSAYSVGSWATKHTDVGDAFTSGTGVQGLYLAYAETYTTSDVWWKLYRGCFCFDTSSLVGKTILSAKLCFRGAAKNDLIGMSPSLNVYGLNKGNADIGNTFYETCLEVPMSTAISYAAFNISGYNEFALNAAGLANINLTGLTWFSTRIEDDVNNNAPHWANQTFSQFQCWSTYKGAGYEPYLEVTYADAITTGIVSGLRHIYSRQRYDLEISFGGLSVTEDIVSPETLKIADDAMMKTIYTLAPPSTWHPPMVLPNQQPVWKPPMVLPSQPNSETIQSSTTKWYKKK
jgi:hypothetical protein